MVYIIQDRHETDINPESVCLYLSQGRSQYKDIMLPEYGSPY